MRHLLRTLKSTILPSQRRGTGSSADDISGVTSNEKDNAGRNEKQVNYPSEMDRITKEDSKKERRLKFKSYFERNNVCMVSKFCLVIIAAMNEASNKLVASSNHS